ncbi:hypothetical protein SNEBB_010366 [Seison nebaliae]|nr:hypothetical protein SNEBB_010366 [Seison nebaliae]
MEIIPLTNNEERKKFNFYQLFDQITLSQFYWNGLRYLFTIDFWKRFTSISFLHYFHCLLFISLLIGAEVSVGALPHIHLLTFFYDLMKMFLGTITKLLEGTDIVLSKTIPELSMERIERNKKTNLMESFIVNGYMITIIMSIIRLLSLLPLPICFGHLYGLLFYETSPKKRKNDECHSIDDIFILVRVVTRGDYPELVKKNVQYNFELLQSANQEHFGIEVVTERHLDSLENLNYVRELIVKEDYVTRSGARFKSRALQFAIEHSSFPMRSNDILIHLDEETLLTTSSIYGILNFITNSRGDIGQGMITYANQNIVNWITTLADSFRVGTDLGTLRFNLKYYGRPLYLFKGSYVVTRFGCEKKVSFDNGRNGSIAEDAYFAMKATELGYKFDWIEGECWEKSPFNFQDFLRQRRRWLQGIYLVVHDRKLSKTTRFGLALALYSWITLPLMTMNIILVLIWPIDFGRSIDALSTFLATTNLYLYFIGAAKSFNRQRLGLIRYLFTLMGAVCTIPFVIVSENIAVIWGLFSEKNKFYIVEKA